MGKTIYTPLVQEFIDDLERMNGMYNNRDYTLADKLERELSSRLSDIKSDASFSITLPFSEGDTYYTIENGEVVTSCWDDQSEEIFMANLDNEYESTVAYFIDVEDAYIAIRERKFRECKQKFVELMHGRYYTSLTAEERNQTDKMLEELNEIGDEYINR